MPPPSRPALPALLIACAFAATGIAPARAEIVALPPGLAASALSSLSDQAGDDAAPPVQVENRLAQPTSSSAVGRSQPARRCSAGAACADGRASAHGAADAQRDDDRYDFYWRIRVAGADVNTQAPADPMHGGAGDDAAVDVAVAHRDEASTTRIGSPGTRSPWLFVATPAPHAPGASDGFVLVADRDGAASVQGGPSARLPDVDPQVDALPEPPAWALLALGVSWLCVAAWRRHTRRD